MCMPPNQSRQKISDVLDALGISFDLIARKGLQFHQEAQELLVAEVDAQGKEYFLIPEATQAWHRLKQAARRDEIVVEIVSAFRSVERQIDIIRVKLHRQAIANITPGERSTSIRQGASPRKSPSNIRMRSAGCRHMQVGSAFIFLILAEIRPALSMSRGTGAFMKARRQFDIAADRVRTQGSP